MDLNRQIRRLMLPSLVVLLAGCGGGTNEPTSRPEGIDRPTARALSAVAAAPSVAVPDVAVIGMNKVRETRIGRTIFEYDYQIVLQNNGPARASVVATLVGAGAGTTIVNGKINLDPIAAGATVTPGDIITLRHDRTRPFQPAALQWEFSTDPTAFIALPGSPTDQAVDQIPEFRAAVTFPGTEIDLDLANGGVTVIRSKWILGFKPATTVSQINSLLQSLGAPIVRSYLQTAVLEIRVPDPGSLSAMNSGLASLRANPVIEFAIPVMIQPPNALPAILQKQAAQQIPPQFNRIAHHLAVKSAAAWNARRAQPAAVMPGRLSLVVVDEFGGGPPVPDLIAGYISTEIGAGFSQTSLYSHGYHVLGIAVASFNDLSKPGLDVPDSSSISGMYAVDQRLSVEVADLISPFEGCVPGIFGRRCSGITKEDIIYGLVRANKALGGRMVVNYSYGYNNAPAGGSPITVESEKKYWLSLLRGRSPNVWHLDEDGFIVVTSAGNNPSFSAGLNNAWASAAADNKLAVSNTATVENRSAAASAPFAAAGIHRTSSIGGNISAIGSNTNAMERDQGIWSYGNAFGAEIDRGGFRKGAPFFAEMQGTSMAAPQVSGLAASLWALRPDFTSTLVLKTILDNASNLTPLAGQPLIDAYATLLAADDPAALVGVMGNPTRAPVRMAILDLDEDDQFTYADALLFAKAISDSRGGTAYDVSTLTSVRTPSGLKTLDRSRFDLNGDGFVGGGGKARFNLDIDYDPPRTARYGVASYTVPPQQVVQLNEAAVTDFEVLCYYVYSPLWRDKDGKTRRSFEEYLRTLSPAMSCGGVSLSVVLPSSPTGLYFTGADFRPSQRGVVDPLTKLCRYEFVEVSPPYLRQGLDTRRCDIAAWRLTNPRGTFKVALTVTELTNANVLDYAESDPVTFHSGPGVVGIQSLVCNAGRFTTQIVGGGAIGTVISASPRGDGTLSIDSCGTWGAIPGGSECQRRTGDPVDTLISASGRIPTYVYNDGVGVLSAKLNGLYIYNYYANPLIYFGFGGTCR